MFTLVREWLSRREALKMVAKDQRLEQERSSALFDAMLERAESAVAADQHKQALAIWSEIRDRFFREAVKSKNILVMLLKIHAFDEAERLMSRGREIFPRDNFYLIGLARIAEQRGEAATALERWRLVRKNMPDYAEAYAGLSTCLVKLGKYDEAEQIIQSGLKKAPLDTVCLMQSARVAEMRGNLDDAAARWENLRKSQSRMGHPSYQNGTLGLAGCLRRMGKFDEAATLMQNYVSQIGLQEAPLAELARIAEDRADLQAAIMHWERFKKSFPMNPTGYVGLIKALKAAGKSEQIEPVYADLLERLPDTVWAASEYARLAEDRGDLLEGAARWKIVNKRFPDDERGYLRYAAALAAIGEAEEADRIKSTHQKLFMK